MRTTRAGEPMISEFSGYSLPSVMTDPAPTMLPRPIRAPFMFNTLGRFKGMNDEMSFIVLHSLAEYPAWQARAAAIGTAQQLVHVATGEGTDGWLGHTYGIIERYIPAQLRPMRSAQQQRWHFDFTAINRLHVPVALASMLLAAILFGHGARRRRDRAEAGVADDRARHRGQRRAPPRAARHRVGRHGAWLSSHHCPAGSPGAEQVSEPSPR